MTNRDLLELAAKAAGIEICGPIEKYIAQPNKEHIGGFLVRNDKGGDSAWNPLDDDGDAFRLSVQLSLHTQRYEGALYISHPGGWTIEGVGDDPYAATRRAIVRAAAKIGRQS